MKFMLLWLIINVECEVMGIGTIKVKMFDRIVKTWVM